MSRKPGFTLVELMVVITIIVVLFALTSPAIERAIYRAELTVCASRLHAMANGTIAYAISFNRHYPYRPGVEEHGNWEAHKLYQSFSYTTPIDERPSTKSFIPLETTLDPLCKRIFIDESATDPKDLVFRNSDLWAGFKWDGFPGMKKIGDRLTWTDDYYRPGLTTRFALLASDRDFMNYGQKIVDSSHPDDEDLLIPLAWQSQDVSSGFGLVADTLLQTTYSGWYRLGVVYRGKSDLNYAYDDGSVRRIDGVLYQDDERMTPVPHFPNITGVPTVGTWPAQFDNLPLH